MSDEEPVEQVAQKKRKLSYQYVEINNPGFLKWFKSYKKEMPYVENFLMEMDADNNWTSNLKCVGDNCRTNNLPFSVREADSPRSIKIRNGMPYQFSDNKPIKVKRHITRHHVPLSESDVQKKKQEEAKSSRNSASVHFRPRRKIPTKPKTDFFDAALQMVCEQHVSMRSLSRYQKYFE